VSPEESQLAVQGCEEIGEGADALRTSQKENPFRIQAVVKERQQFFLQIRRQIDQQIAADEDIQLGKGGLHDDVLRGKGHHLPDLLADPVAVIFLYKKTFQSLGRHISRDVERIDPLAGFVDRILVQVGGIDLQFEVCRGLNLFQRLLEGNGQRIRLLPGRAACRPGPQYPAVRSLRQQRGENRFPDLFPCLRVAEKAGHADQQFLEEEHHLLGIFLQIADVSSNPVDLVDGHAPLYPAVDRILLVQGEILTGLGPQQDEDFLQGALVLLLQ